MKKIFYFIGIIVFSLVMACDAKAQTTDDLERELQAAFRDIYLSLGGLEFPMYEKDVKRCYANRWEMCLKTFNAVMEAKQFVLNQIRSDPQRTLSITLDTIFKFAELIDKSERSKTDTESYFESSTCHGAILALYFFNQDEQDRKIMNYIKAAPSIIVDRIIDTGHEWLYNRPDPERWVTFVETLPEKKYSSHYKKHIIETLKNTNYRKFSIMLDRSAIAGK